MGSRSLPSTPLGPRTPRHSGGGGSSMAALSSPGGDLRLHQMIAVQGRTDGSLSLSLPCGRGPFHRKSGGSGNSSHIGLSATHDSDRPFSYSCLEDVHEERISFLDPELRSAHNRIDVLETCSEANAKTIERLERELQERYAYCSAVVPVDGHLSIHCGLFIANVHACFLLLVEMGALDGRKRQINRGGNPPNDMWLY